MLYGPHEATTEIAERPRSSIRRHLSRIQGHKRRIVLLVQPERSYDEDGSKTKNGLLADKHRLRIKSHASWMWNLLVVILNHGHDDATASLVVVEANEYVNVIEISIEALGNAVLIAVVVLA